MPRRLDARGAGHGGEERRADGFCAPSSSEMRIASTPSSIASSAARACGGWLPAMITRRPPRAARRGTAARRRRGRRRRSSRAARRGRRPASAPSRHRGRCPGRTISKASRVRPVEGRHRPEHAEHRQPGDAEPVGPAATRSASRRSASRPRRRPRRRSAPRDRTVVSQPCAAAGERHGEGAGGGH